MNGEIEMEHKYTKGPWYFTPDEFNGLGLNNAIGSIRSKDENEPNNGWYIATIENKDTEEDEANACLIAAAPELLEALQCTQALDMPHGEGKDILEKAGFDYSNRFEFSATAFANEKARAAIAKAKP